MIAKVLVTGAHGFIGAALCRALSDDGIAVFAPLRDGQTRTPADIGWIPCTSIADLGARLPEGLDAVIHLAARVHQVNETGTAAAAEHMRINHDDTLALATAARRAGAARFIFASSVKALGEREPGRPYREADEARPTDAYGRSKRAAERDLLAMAGASFAPVVLRFPLVYGPGVRANFRALWRAVGRGWPLPLGCATAPRSLLGLSNAVDALRLCLQHPQAAGALFHIADQDTPSVAELVRAMARAQHTRARLVPVPRAILKIGGALSGRADTIDRLITPLRLDTRHARETLGWRPVTSLAEGLAAMAAAEACA